MARKKGILLILSMIIFLLTNYTQAMQDNITFRLTFENGFTPDISCGNSAPTFLGTESDFNMSDGIEGKGFLTGRAGQSLMFKSKGNLSEKEGTVTLWMRGLSGVHWNKIDNKHYWFLIFRGEDGTLYFYKYYQSPGTWLYREYRKELNKQFTRISFANYIEDRWNFFAFTWKENGTLSFYVNGNLIGEANDFTFPKITDEAFFIIGQTKGGEPSENIENRIMDNITFYNKALSNYEIVDIYRKEGSILFNQEIVICKKDNTVTIDGRIEPSEWDNSTVIPIAIEDKNVKVTDTISYLHLMYDEDYLYFLLYSPIPDKDLADPHGKLLHGFFKKDTLRHDESVDHDDSLEINLIPGVENENADFYRLVVNTIDTKYDYVIHSSGATELAWSPEWDVKSSFDERGWLLEAKVPFNGFGRKMPVPGEIWQGNFHRIWKQLRNQKDSWAVGKHILETGEFKKYSLGKIVFGGKESITVSNINIKNLHLLIPEINLTLCNHREQLSNVRVSITDGKENLMEKSVAIKAKEQISFDWKEDIKKYHPTELSIKITDIDTGETYYSLCLPLLNEDSIDIKLRSYPSLDMIRIEGDVSALSIPPKDLNVKISLMKENLVQKELSFIPDSLFFEKEIDVSTLEPSGYLVVVTIYQEEKVVTEMKIQFIKKPLPVWYNNQLGITDEVPPPWVPLKIKGPDTITCWGREYLYNKKLLPSQITSQGQHLLSRPINLMLDTPKGKIDLNTINSQIVFGKKTDAKIRWQNTVISGGIKIVNNSYIEFDGMLWTEIKLIPEQQQAEINSLTIIIPLKKEYAILINPYDYSLKTTGYLPEKGWAGSLRPLWIGNNQVGIQFFGETDFNWQVQDRYREIEIIPSDSEVLLKINFIDKPFILRKEETFSFGLEATPVKPINSDHRKWRIGHPHIISKFTPEQDIEFLAAWCTGWSKVFGTSGEVSYPIPKDDLKPKMWDYEVDGRKGFSFPYCQLMQTWAESEEFKQFGDEWINNLKERYIPPLNIPVQNRLILVCQASRSWQDFVLYGLDLLQKKANPRGYYFDVSTPTNCNNIFHGCGYKDENTGQYNSTFNVLGTRELVKRIYIHLKKHRPDGMILYHNSGQVLMPIHGFADILCDGENAFSLLDRLNNRGYENFLTLDTFRAEYMGHNLGSVVAFMPEFTRAKSIRVDEADEVGPQHAEYVLGLILLHDSALWITYFYDERPVKTMYQALSEYNFASAPYKFIPYWNQQITQKLDEKEAVVSFYVDKSKGRALMVVMNMSGKKKPFSFSINTAELGFAPKKVINACHSENVSINKEVLTIDDVPSHTYRLLVLEAK